MKTRFVEESFLDPSQGQCARAFQFVCEGALGTAQHPVLDHPPHSPDVVPCDYYLFPKVKSDLKETKFVRVESAKAKAAETINKLTKEEFQHCFA